MTSRIAAAALTVIDLTDDMWPLTHTWSVMWLCYSLFELSLLLSTCKWPNLSVYIDIYPTSVCQHERINVGRSDYRLR